MLKKNLAQSLLLAAALLCQPGARAEDALGFGRGKLLLTGGVSSIDGAAGGGLTPWALVGSYASQGEIGATAHLTRMVSQDYALSAYGATVGISDRFEISLARQELDARVVAPDAILRQTILGFKARLAGEAILDSDNWMPQLALGVEFKDLSPGPSVSAALSSVGAKRHGVDVYLSATKLFLAPSLLVSGTLRASSANQNGLLGFGSSQGRRARILPEMSIAWLPRRDLALGVEYRMKPNQLEFAGSAFAEQDWKDAFIAWAPSKRVSLTLAYVGLGNIVGKPSQRGAYLSLQLTP